MLVDPVKRIQAAYTLGPERDILLDLHHRLKKLEEAADKPKLTKSEAAPATIPFVAEDDDKPSEKKAKGGAK